MCEPRKPGSSGDQAGGHRRARIPPRGAPARAAGLEAGVDRAAASQLASAVALRRRRHWTRAAARGVARARHSLCRDDADDALQRASLILLTKAPTVDPGRLIAWMVVVTKHEAMAVRRGRERVLACLASERPPHRSARRFAGELPGPAERAERDRERRRGPGRARGAEGERATRDRAPGRRATPTPRSASSAAGPTRRSTAHWRRAARGCASSGPWTEPAPRRATHRAPHGCSTRHSAGGSGSDTAFSPIGEILRGRCRRRMSSWCARRTPTPAV